MTTVADGRGRGCGAILVAGWLALAVPVAVAQEAFSGVEPGSGQDFRPPQPASATAPLDPNGAGADRSIVNVPAAENRAERQQLDPEFTVSEIGEFDAPFAMAFLPDGRLLVSERAGQLKLRTSDGIIFVVGGVPPIAIGVRSNNLWDGREGGLMDVALAPDFETSGLIYLTYAEPASIGPTLALWRGRLAGDEEDPRLEDGEVLWRAGSNGPGSGFGGAIAFAPDGRHLFLTLGDRERMDPAQDPDQLVGKIVRLTLDGGAAPGNPEDDRGGARATVWSSGHRNHYGLAFSPDGRLWSTELGPDGGDELNLIEPGRNYGWPLVSNGRNYDESPIPAHPSRPDFAAPKLWWYPSIAPSSLMAYTGDMFPDYRGSLFIGSMWAPGLHRVVLDGDRAEVTDNWRFDRIRDVAQAPDGAIWVLEDGRRGGQGRLFRLTPFGDGGGAPDAALRQRRATGGGIGGGPPR